VQTVKGGPFELARSEADHEINKRVEEVAKRKGWSMAEVALAWVDSKVASPIVGVNSVSAAFLW
jgi:aryl-alcohol dehydrogenase-like predicted oxidoreductase